MELLRQIAELRSPLLDAVMLAVSFLSSPLVILTIISWIYYNEDSGRAACTGISFSFAYLLGEGMKIIIRAPRPWVVDPSFQPVYQEAVLRAGYAFPGIRTLAVTAVAVAGFYYRKNKIFRAVMVICIAAAAFAELYLGYCTPQAVLAGFLIAAVIAAVTLFFWNRYLSRRSDYGIFTFLMTGLAAALIFLALALEINGTIEPGNAASCYEAAGTSIGFALGSYVTRRFAHFSTNEKAFRKVNRFMLGLLGTLLIAYAELLLNDVLNCPARILLNLAEGFWLFGAAPLIFSAFTSARSAK